MYPPIVDRQPLHRLLTSLSDALDLRMETIRFDSGYRHYLLFGLPEDISYACRSLRSWGFQHVIADVGGSSAVKSVIVKWVWEPAKEQ